MVKDEAQPFYVRATIILIGTLAAIYILNIGQSIFVPLIFALFLAILLNPMVNFLARKGVPRLMAIFLALLVAIGVVALIVFFVSMQFSAFSHIYPELKVKFHDTSNDILCWCSDRLNVDVSQIRKWISSAEADTLTSVRSGMSHTIVGIGAAMMVVVLIPIYIILILYYRPLLVEFIHRSFKAEHHATVGKVLVNVNVIIKSYLYGLLVEGAIVAFLNSAALLVLGVRYAILLGITGAILNVIPFIGGIIAILLPMIVAFVTKSVLTAVLVFVIYILIQFIDNHYLIPYIVASKVKINALAAIVVVLIGNEIWGIPGMFLSIPLTALLKVIFDNIEPLHSFGFLLGDTVPPYIRFDWFWKRPGN